MNMKIIKELDKKDNFIEKKKELENIKKIVKIKNEIMEIGKDKKEYIIFSKYLNKISLNNDKNNIIVQTRISLLNNITKN